MPSENSQLEHALMLSKAEANAEEENEAKFEEILLKERGFLVKKMPDDGNCLFAAVADQLLNDPERHFEIRNKCADYMMSARDHFSQFITEDIDDYVMRKRQWGVYGNNLEIQALSEGLCCPIEVYQYDSKPLNIFQGQYINVNNKPIRISYHRGNHYNSVISTSEIEIPPDDASRKPEFISTQSLPKSVPSKPIQISLPKEERTHSSNTLVREQFVCCSECGQPCPDYEELQIHMLTSCPLAVQFN